MLDQIQDTVSVLSLASHEQHSPFLSQMPKQVVFGHVTLTNDQEGFLQGIDAGIECYCEADYAQQQMSAQMLLNNLFRTLHSDTPLAWRLGFIAGNIAGLLNPDIAKTSTSQSCLEVLSRKCKVLYPGPEQLSSYTRFLHQAAGIETVPVEEEASCSQLDQEVQ